MGKNGSPWAPEKDFYRIGEVAALTELAPYVLRYWETEFPRLQPTKSPHGQRLYRRGDVETILAIKQLLYEQGYTIAGARKQLEAENGSSTESVAPSTPPAEAAPPANPQGATREALRAVRAELQGLLTLLSRG